MLSHTHILNMTESTAFHALREQLEGLFPKTCGCCGHQYGSLHGYLQTVQHLGPAVCFDVECGDWHPLKPLGTLMFANCPCGSTLALSSDGMPLLQLWSMLDWVKIESKLRSLTAQQTLSYLRAEVCLQALANAA
ncbi:MAG: hypothetical protein JWO08_4565 [Verrucomicrobiaceae bacterium]|nr:hypothetical protein [Verrucomicrobiaceae bacterium]